MRIIHIASCALAFSLGIAASSSVATADERACRGSLGNVTVDNLRVPAGHTCILERTRVKGTLKVEAGATLKANRIVVIGNVQAEGAKLVVLQARSRIGGSVQIVQGGGARVINSVVDGSIQFESNRQALVVETTTVGSDVQAFQNRGGVRITRNAIDGNLQCKSNRPRPIGGRNVVDGSKEDQCKQL